MGRAEEYREKAQEAERNALLMSRQDERDAMLAIAESWRALAAKEDEQEPPPP
ncbi:MAG: hypothetical protein KKE02_02645 [Alphaproteobacteria bacterium]|nr:hypothetical protein [Alphaproteobacteria bacterium]MBU1513423.1 hypothetical protein [Alphaproteobacteria bacterium]MBU2096415.1 hypothetical protein [Alphaproteobacteria bacterium]MBU2149893.1 hypothetical protein [Alphaproteobacteria bacterium]MBU2308201.1 hypothetical protein [Alphaproteobacteria bacterium]